MAEGLTGPVTGEGKPTSLDWHPGCSKEGVRPAQPLSNPTQQHTGRGRTEQPLSRCSFSRPGLRERDPGLRDAQALEICPRLGSSASTTVQDEQKCPSSDPLGPLGMSQGSCVLLAISKCLLFPLGPPPCVLGRPCESQVALRASWCHHKPPRLSLSSGAGVIAHWKGMRSTQD